MRWPDRILSSNTSHDMQLLWGAFRLVVMGVVSARQGCDRLKHPAAGGPGNMNGSRTCGGPPYFG